MTPSQPSTSSKRLDISNLQKRIAFIAAAWILVAGLIIAGFTAAPFYKNLRQLQQDKLRDDVSLLGQVIDEHLSGLNQITLQITSRTKAREKLEAYNEADVSLSDAQSFLYPILDDALQRHKGILGITRFDISDSPVVSVGQKIPEEYWFYPSDSWIIASIEGPYHCGPMLCLITFATIVDRAFKKVGTDIVSFNLSGLNTFLTPSMNLKLRGEFQMINQSPDGYRVFFNSAKGLIDHMPLVKPGSMNSAVIARINAKDFSLLSIDEPDVESVMLAYVQLKNSNWILLYKVGKKQLYSSVYKQFVLLAGVIAFLLVLSVIGMIFLLRPLGRRVFESTEALRESEEKYQYLYDSAPDMFASVDPQTRKIIRCNQTLANKLGYSKEEIVGHDFFNVHHPSCHTDVERAFKSFVTTGELRDTELQLKHKEGTPLDVSLSVSAVRDENGTILYSNSIWRDITERKHAQDALQNSEEQLRLITESVPAAISYIDAEQRYQYYNAAFDKYFAQQSKSIIGKHIAKALGERAYEMIRPYLEEALAGQQVNFEFNYKQQGGSTQTFDVTYVPHFSADGGISGLYMLSSDITERKQAEADLTKRTEQLIHKQQILLDLAKENFPDLETAFNKILAAAAETLQIERVSVWLFSQDHTEMACQSLYQKGETSREGEIIIKADQYPRYFQALLESSTISANEARNDPRTSEFTEDYLIPLGITSIMDVPVRLQGKMIGVVCHEHIGPGKKWSLEDEEFAISVADMCAMALEVAERKQAEEALRESQRRLRKLATHLQAIREEERTLIAREIHDELGQMLTGLKMDLSWLREHMPGHLKKVSARIDAMILLVDTKVEDTRKLAFRLRPAMLDDLGLEAAIECEVQDFTERAGYDYTLDLKNGNLSQDRNRDTAVFRILQEALINVARHAKASQIDVALCTTNSHLILTVKDNGVGINEDKIESSDSLGLLGMFERAGALGGQIKINKAKEGGTQLTLKMPLVTSTA